MLRTAAVARAASADDGAARAARIGAANVAGDGAAGTGRRGWLIYALVAMPQLGIYPVGGFHEFLVSPDGGRIIETRALSRGCLNLGGEKLPEGASLAAYTATDVISDTPLPQHVFVSLQSKKPLFVMTVRNRRTWRVDGDQIVLVGM